MACLGFKLSFRCYTMAGFTALLSKLHHHHVYDILVFMKAKLKGFLENANNTVKIFYV